MTAQARQTPPAPETPYPGAAYPVADLRGYLTGAWTLARRLVDRRTGETGRFDGRALFAGLEREARALAYREEGRFVLGGFETVAHRACRYAFPEPHRAQVSFADGRAFHDLDLTSGLWTAEHLCGADRYRGAFRALGPDRWSACWEIAGPRKDQRLEGLYVRVA